MSNLNFAEAVHFHSEVSENGLQALVKHIEKADTELLHYLASHEKESFTFSEVVDYSGIETTQLTALIEGYTRADILVVSNPSNQMVITKGSRFTVIVNYLKKHQII